MHARLHVLLARDAPSAVVIRRGPSKQVATIAWDRRKDTFTLAQWYAGRIYARKSDLSPDGQFWIYFALNGKWLSETKGAYTVLARAPYLKAMGLWPVGDTWGGGGLFSRSGRYWPFSNEPLIAPPEPPYTSTSVVSATWYQGVIYFARLMRDGWSMVGKPGEDEPWIHTFEKPATRSWVLRRRCYTRHDTFELQHLSSRCVLNLGWEWGDLDGERLVWAEQGCLWAGRMDYTGLIHVRNLYDFNDMEFRRIKAPY